MEKKNWDKEESDNEADDEKKEEDKIDKAKDEENRKKIMIIIKLKMLKMEIKKNKRIKRSKITK